MQRLKITLAVAVLAAATLALATSASGTKTPPAWTPLTPSAAGPLARIVGLAHGPSGKPFKPGGFPSIAVGSFPVGVGIDTARHTVYVANPGDGTVSVVDGATCNAGHTSGCDQTPPTVSVGNLSLFAAVDEQSHTVYVDNLFDNTISMIDTATCNAADHSGCGNTPPTVSVGSFPVNPAVDIATNTIYVPNNGDNTVSVIDGATCNSTDTSGCAHTHTIAVGSGPTALAIDQATNTIYVPNTNDNTVSVINGATCNGQVSSGCGQTPATIGGVGNSPIGPTAVAVDEASDTVYVTEPVNDNFGTLAMINGATCNGTNHAGCGQIPATVAVGARPSALAVDESTDTIYVANANDNTVSVIDGATCNGQVSSGCGQTPATIAVGDFPDGLAIDAATHTLYVENRRSNFPFVVGSVSLVDTTACNAAITSGCSQAPPTVAVGGAPFGITIDPARNDVYVNSLADADVAVIDGNACNATRTKGCQPDTIPVRMGGFGGSIAIDQAAHTAYVPSNGDANVSFFRLGH